MLFIYLLVWQIKSLSQLQGGYNLVALSQVSDLTKFWSFAMLTAHSKTTFIQIRKGNLLYILFFPRKKEHFGASIVCMCIGYMHLVQSFGALIL